MRPTDWNHLTELAFLLSYAKVLFFIRTVTRTSKGSALSSFL